MTASRQLNPPADATGRDAGGAVAAAETAAWRKSPARRDCGRLVLDSETPALDDTQSSAPVLTLHLLRGGASVSAEYVCELPPNECH
jgi:hypothetical protein